MNFSNNPTPGNESLYRGMNSYNPQTRLINSYGLSSSFLESLGIFGPLVTKVFVANIDYFVDSKMLEEVFEMAGQVLSVELLSQDGKSRGMAIIEYSHPFEAVQAISLFHNQLYYDRRITVRMDRNAEKEATKTDELKLPNGLKSIGIGLGSNGSPMKDLSNLPCTLVPMTNVPWNRSNGNNMFSNTNDPMNDMSNMQREINGIASNLSMRNSDLTQMNESRMGFSNNQTMGMSPNSYNNSMSTFNYPFNQSNASSQQGLPTNNCVLQINNLPYDCTWQNLRDLCKMYGEVRFSEIVCRGTGRVRFAYEGNARKAAENLLHKMIDGRMLEARLV